MVKKIDENMSPSTIRHQMADINVHLSLLCRMVYSEGAICLHPTGSSPTLILITNMQL